LLLYTITPRTILYQVIPQLTILSIFTTSTAGCPLFVQDAKFNSRLPPLLVVDALELARLRERLFMGPVPSSTTIETGETVFLDDEIPPAGNIRMRTIVREYKWLVHLRAYSIFILESRLITYLVNCIQVVLSVAILYSPSPLWLVLGLVAVVPVSIAYAVLIIMWLGKRMCINDYDLRLFFTFAKHTRGYAREFYLLVNRKLSRGNDDRKGETERTTTHSPKIDFDDDVLQHDYDYDDDDDDDDNDDDGEDDIARSKERDTLDDDLFGVHGDGEVVPIDNPLHRDAGAAASSSVPFESRTVVVSAHAWRAGDRPNER